MVDDQSFGLISGLLKNVLISDGWLLKLSQFPYPQRSYSV